MNCQTLKKCVPKGCSVFFAISVLFITVVGIWLISIIPKKLTTECNNIKLHTQVEVDSVPEKVYFSDEGRYLYILSGEKAWRYDILLGEKEIVDSDNIPDPPPPFTLPDEPQVYSSGKTVPWSIIKAEMDDRNKEFENYIHKFRSKFVFSPDGKVCVLIEYRSREGSAERPYGPATWVEIKSVTARPDGNVEFLSKDCFIHSTEYLVSDAVFSNDARLLATMQKKETAKEKIVAIWIIEDGSKIGAKVYPWTGG